MKTLVYQTYVTDALQSIAENTSGSNKTITLSARYIEKIQGINAPEPGDDRTGDEIISDIRAKISILNGGKTA